MLMKSNVRDSPGGRHRGRRHNQPMLKRLPHRVLVGGSTGDEDRPSAEEPDPNQQPDPKTTSDAKEQQQTEDNALLAVLEANVEKELENEQKAYREDHNKLLADQFDQQKEVNELDEDEKRVGQEEANLTELQNQLQSGSKKLDEMKARYDRLRMSQNENAQRQPEGAEGGLRIAEEIDKLAQHGNVLLPELQSVRVNFNRMEGIFNYLAKAKIGDRELFVKEVQLRDQALRTLELESEEFEKLIDKYQEYLRSWDGWLRKERQKLRNDLRSMDQVVPHTSAMNNLRRELQQRELRLQRSEHALGLERRRCEDQMASVQQERRNLATERDLIKTLWERVARLETVPDNESEPVHEQDPDLQFVLDTSQSTDDNDD